MPTSPARTRTASIAPGGEAPRETAALRGTPRESENGYTMTPAVVHLAAQSGYPPTEAERVAAKGMPLPLFVRESADPSADEEATGMVHHGREGP